MHLLKYGSNGRLSLTTFVDNFPPYAILSHTWGEDSDEITFDDLKNRSGKSKAGYEKIRFCGKQAGKDNLQYFWIDTCCINKANLTELSEAITSMFRWYRDAEKCYVYLSDVSVHRDDNNLTERTWKSAFRKNNWPLKRKSPVRNDDNNKTERTWESAFRQSKWFTRGWTLQELIAPRSVEFFSQEGDWLGNKITLERQIHEITNVPIAALRGASLSGFGVDERLRWAEKRKTKKKEDKAYCLLGIFDVSMSLRYGEGGEAFNRLKKKVDSSSGTTLDEIDAAVRNYYLRDGCLAVERLSGKNLPMERCFINLGIVDHIRDGHVKGIDDESDRNPDIGHHLSKFSLNARLRVETPSQAEQVTLQTLFRPRKRPDGTTARPNRVLIWGRAGVGKTTLCKKSVYDFIHKGLWCELYDRVFWLPLRKLKLMRNEPSSLGELIQKEYFFDASDGQLMAEVLQKALVSHDNRTLFILDGLDEVSYVLDPESPMGRILRRLLKQDNVVITSRPHSTNILDHIPLDLELETIGFFPEQVEEYLRNETKQTNTSEKSMSEKRLLEIRSFIQGYPIVQSLVRIPIQLDAICYAWDTEHFPKDNVTMTTLYRAIIRRLWEKDIIRLDKMFDGERITRQQIQDCPDSKRFVEGEVRFLENLAFGGLFNEIVEFGLEYIRKLNTSQKPMLNDGTVRMSFLRSSDNSLNPANRTCHFIHLTFQEFFAAQYFARQWTSGATLSLLKMESEGSRSSKNAEQITPEDFVRREKYSVRYDIFWRFVVGLLQIEEDHCHLHRFFDVLEDEPRDLLGPTHQRLTIHCLSEINTADDEFRSRVRKLEENYLQWILFELKFNSSTALMMEMECPDEVFRSLLKETPELKKKAMLTLANRPSISSETLDMVICELSDKTDEFRWKDAFRVLGKHCNQTSKEKFIDAFRDAETQLEAIDAFSQSQTFSGPAVDALIQLLRDEDSYVRSGAADVLGEQSTLPGLAVDALIQSLRDEDSYVRSCAVDALGEQSTLPNLAVDALVQLLRDEDLSVRSGAADVLGEQSTLPGLAVDALVQLLRDKDSSVRSRAADVLGKQSTLPDPAVDALIQSLHDEDSSVRSCAAGALGRQSSLPDLAVDALIQSLHDEDSYVRSCAADALGRHSFLSGLAVDALIQSLHDEDSSVRSRAAGALGRQSFLSGQAVDALIQSLHDEDSSVRSCAAGALGRQSSLPDLAVDALIQSLHDEDSYVRSCAADALGRHSFLSGLAVDALIQSLRDKDSSVRPRAANALGRHSSLPDLAVDALIQSLRDEDSSVRFHTANALGRQSTLPDLAVDALIQSLRDKNSHLRSCAANALGGQSTLPGLALKALIPLLQLDISSADAARVLQVRKEFYLLIPTLDSSILQNLLMIWLRKSFRNSVTCFIWNGTLSIDVGWKLQRIPLEKRQQEVFEHAYLMARKAIQSPLPVTCT